MPKKPIDYSNCCIYKIEHIENEILIYVGHTTNFKQRKAEHKNTCNNENHTRFNLKLYIMIRENSGWEMFVMIEVEKYQCNDKREAEKRENELMKELKASMNKYRSFRTN
jgi:predicted GIY-YIG superfamily endonuclease